MHTENSIAPLFVSAKEGQRVVGLGATKFNEMIKAGEVETVLFGRRRLVVYESLKELAARLRQQAKSAEAA